MASPGNGVSLIFVVPPIPRTRWRGWLHRGISYGGRATSWRHPSIPHAEQFYETVTLNTLDGHCYLPEERIEIDRLLRQRRRLLKRIAEIDHLLAKIAKEGAIIKPHCPASPDEIRALVGKYQKQMHDEECFRLGFKIMRAQQWQTFRKQQRATP
jgi:hypothetical protein